MPSSADGERCNKNIIQALYSNSNPGIRKSACILGRPMCIETENPRHRENTYEFFYRESYGRT